MGRKTVRPKVLGDRKLDVFFRKTAPIAEGAVAVIIASLHILCRIRKETGIPVKNRIPVFLLFL